MKNISQIAIELGVSRNKIYKAIDKLNIAIQKDGRKSCIADDNYKRLKARIDGQSEDQTQSTKERLKRVVERDRSMIGGNISDREYIDLKEHIHSLEQQLSVKDQQLQTKDNQINGLIQANLNYYKALLPGNEVAATIQSNTKLPLLMRLFGRKTSLR